MMDLQARNTKHETSSSSEDEGSFGFGFGAGFGGGNTGELKAARRKSTRSAKSDTPAASYATADIPRWQHPNCNRDMSEKLLRASGVKQGQFLVRESSTSMADFVLSIRNGSRVVHCRIVRNHKGLYTLKICAERKFVDKDGNRGGPWFTSMVKVVEAFAVKPIPNIFTPGIKGRKPKGVTLAKAVDRPGFEEPAYQQSRAPAPEYQVPEDKSKEENAYSEWKTAQQDSEPSLKDQLQINTLNLKMPLGILTEGSAKHGCFIVECIPGQSAATSGKVKAGLRIMSVNSKSTRNQTPAKVMDTIRNSVDNCRVVLAMDVASLTAFRKEDKKSILSSDDTYAYTTHADAKRISAGTVSSPGGADYRAAPTPSGSSVDYRKPADLAKDLPPEAPPRASYAAPQNSARVPQKDKKGRPAPLAMDNAAANDDVEGNEAFFTPRETPLSGIAPRVSANLLSPVTGSPTQLRRKTPAVIQVKFSTVCT